MTDPDLSEYFDDQVRDLLLRVYSYILSDNWGKSNSADDSSTVSGKES